MTDLLTTDYINNVIKQTHISIQKYKLLGIYNSNDLNVCSGALDIIQDQLLDYNNYSIDKVKEDIIILFKSYGTNDLLDLLNMTFGFNYINKYVSQENKEKMTSILKYSHPISCKIITWDKKVKKTKNKILEDLVYTDHKYMLNCVSVVDNYKSFYIKNYGFKIIFTNPLTKTTLITTCICDNLLESSLNFNFIVEKKEIILNYCQQNNILKEYLNIFNLKDYLINDENYLLTQIKNIIIQKEILINKPVSHIVKEYINSSLYEQRNILILTLTETNNIEFQFLAYLLYDLLSNDNNNQVDTINQNIILDSLPWSIKKCFKEAMKNTIDYSNKLLNYDNNKIPLEQQICLLKVNDNIKEKAMIKLKEVKSKSDDTCSKARHYIDGLLKIPFNIYKNEPIMCYQKNNIIKYSKLVTILDKYKLEDLKNNYTNVDIIIFINKYEIIKNEFLNICKKSLSDFIDDSNKKVILDALSLINKTKRHIAISNKNLKSLKTEIINYIDKNEECIIFFNELLKNNNVINDYIYTDKIVQEIISINSTIHHSVSSIKSTLDNVVYGHNLAKRNIERIIGQWINGTNEGYCLGFEGPPGVGKTSLAKHGIAQILKDSDDSSRPFAFIAVGGDSNASTIHGHNYTYVGSSWGRICDILMEKQCMNPIIFIDELDKISKTEQGKEIIGILTHLVDPTQNSTFQDKFFSGIDLDLSKVLFIFSYNDPDSIDRILLDRIHRIKFKHLTIDEKVIITKEYIFPELLEKMGLKNKIELSIDVIKHLIVKYTIEPGVRKLKELLYEIIGEINLLILSSNDISSSLLEITIQDIDNIYLKEKDYINIIKIPSTPKVGFINGLWANAMGCGGIINIETSFIIANNMLELKLTGSQGDVMKESMNVAKTLAWNLLTSTQKVEIQTSFEKNKNQGIHIHCPEGGVSKDGPSAGTAITMAIYSLLINKPISNTIAITGEINIKGNVTVIGGLDLKILGGIEAGVKTFIFPYENIRDFNKIKEKYNNDMFDNIEFLPVKSVDEVIKILFN